MPSGPQNCGLRTQGYKFVCSFRVMAPPNLVRADRLEAVPYGAGGQVDGSMGVLQALGAEPC